MNILISAILFAPLLASVVITLFTLRYKKLSALLSIGSILISLFLSLYAFSHFSSLTASGSWEFSLPWIQVAGLTLEWG